MNTIELINMYEEKFNENIAIPYIMPENKTIEDFNKALKKCIDENVKFDYEKFGIKNDSNIKY